MKIDFWSSRYSETTLPINQLWVVLCVFAVIGFSIYSNILNGEFISDDYVTIVDNASIRHLDPVAIWKAFNTRFLTGYTFALNFHFGGLNPFGFHLVNIIIHILNSFLVYLFLRLTFMTPVLKLADVPVALVSLAAALIFLCHPLQIQAVSFITQRSISLATFFYIATLIFYLKGRLENVRFYGLSWLIMFLGVFTKETMLTLPGVLIIIEGFFFNDFFFQLKQHLKRILPYLLLALLIPIVLLYDRVDSNFALKYQISHRMPSWNYFLTELNVVMEYFKHMILPVNLNHDYDFPIAKSIFELRTIWAISFLSLLGGFIVWQWRKQRLLVFCVLWFFITLTLEFWVPVFVNAGVMYDHWTYLPMVGFALLISYGIYFIVRDTKIFKVIGLCLCFTLCTLTYIRNFVWQNEIVFWENVSDHSAHKPWVYLGLGKAYQNKNLNSLALAAYEKGLRLFFKSRSNTRRDFNQVYLARIYNNIGMIYSAQGQYGVALEYYVKSVDVYPFMAEPYNNIAFRYLEWKDYSRALNYYRKSLENRGQHDKTCLYLPEVYQALKMKPDDLYVEVCQSYQ